VHIVYNRGSLELISVYDTFNSRRNECKIHITLIKNEIFSNILFQIRNVQGTEYEA